MCNAVFCIMRNLSDLTICLSKYCNVQLKDIQLDECVANVFLLNAEEGCIFKCDMDRWEHSAGCKERLLRGSSAPPLPLFSLTHYPGGSVLAPQSGPLLLLINLQER